MFILKHNCSAAPDDEQSDAILDLCIPSFFCRVAPPPPAPLPIPGFVQPEDLETDSEDDDPDFAFLVPCECRHKSSFVNEVMTLKDWVASQKSLICQIDFDIWNTFYELFELENSIRIIFSLPDDPVEEILQSLKSPFSTFENGTSIAWTMIREIHPTNNGSSSSNNNNKNCRRKQQPWSVLCVGDEDTTGDADDAMITVYRPKKNMIFDGQGLIRAQVDFGHAGHMSIHVHPLLPGSLEHSAPEHKHHCLPYRQCPWFWSAVPGQQYNDSHMYKKQNNNNNGTTTTTTKLPQNLKEIQEEEFEWVNIKITTDMK